MLFRSIRVFEGKELPRDGKAFGDLLVRGPWITSAYMKAEGGEASFAVLLFQDIAVIPILALFPLLGEKAVEQAAGAHGASGPGGGHGPPGCSSSQA